MNYLLFFSAIFLMICSIAVCILYNVIYWRNNIYLFKQLLKDNNFKFDVENDEAYRQTPIEGNELERCWLKTAFRKITPQEIKLSKIITGTGLIGGVALVLSLSLMTVPWGLVCGFFAACVLQYVYRNVIYFIAHFIAWKKIRRIYYLHLKGEL